MPDRPLCSKNNCTNLSRLCGTRKDGSIRYGKLCHSHSNESNRLKQLNEIITPEKVPNNYSRPFKIWCEMRRRVDKEDRPYYNFYGGKGVKYDERWKSFKLFWEDMGETYSDILTLDRINANGDYTKENCRWADWVTQMNNRTYAHKLTYNGMTMGISEWSRATGIKRTTIKERINTYGWSIEKTLTIGAK